MTFTFCPSCGSQLRLQSVNGSERLACDASQCQFVHWNNPIPVVAALVCVNDTYILARNADWPDGVFSVLTGFLEESESPESAVAREVVEELGLQVRDVRFIGHFPLVEYNQLIIAYACQGEGALELSDEISETRSISKHDLADYDFGPLRVTQDIVARWVEMSR